MLHQKHKSLTIKYLRTKSGICVKILKNSALRWREWRALQGGLWFLREKEALGGVAKTT